MKQPDPARLRRADEPRRGIDGSLLPRAGRGRSRADTSSHVDGRGSAIRFYDGTARVVPASALAELLRRYWSVPAQIETSVVLAGLGVSFDRRATR